MIQATYTALKEVETRSMDLLPTWRLPEPFLYAVSPEDGASRMDAVEHSRGDDQTRGGREEDGGGRGGGGRRGGVGARLPQRVQPFGTSVSHRRAGGGFRATQLRDDLLSLLVAGHETTASVLTWGTYELLKPENAEQLRLIRAELDEVLGDKPYPSFEDMAKLPTSSGVPAHRCGCTSATCVHPPRGEGGRSAQEPRHHPRGTGLAGEHL